MRAREAAILPRRNSPCMLDLDVVEEGKHNVLPWSSFVSSRLRVEAVAFRGKSRQWIASIVADGGADRPGCCCDSVCAAGCGSSERPRQVKAYATQRLCAPS